MKGHRLGSYPTIQICSYLICMAPHTPKVLSFANHATFRYFRQQKGSLHTSFLAPDQCLHRSPYMPSFLILHCDPTGCCASERHRQKCVTMRRDRMRQDATRCDTMRHDATWRDAIRLLELNVCCMPCSSILFVARIESALGLKYWHDRRAYLTDSAWTERVWGHAISDARIKD